MSIVKNVWCGVCVCVYVCACQRERERAGVLLSKFLICQNEMKHLQTGQFKKERKV